MEGVQVDITDPEDIRAKLPELEALIAQRRREIDRLDATVDKLAAFAGVRRRHASRNGGSKRQKAPARPKGSRRLVVEIVNKLGGAASIDNVAERMDPPMKRETVGWALWQAAKDGDLQA